MILKITKNYLNPSLTKEVNIETRSYDLVHLQEGVVFNLVIRVTLLCLCVFLPAQALEIPKNWTQTKSNPNYAYRIDSYEFAGQKQQSLSLMDLEAYSRGDYDDAVVDLVDSNLVSEINPKLDVSPNGESVIFQVVARAGGGLLDSVIFMNIPEAGTIRDLVLNNIFSDGISKKKQEEIYKLTDIKFKQEQNRSLATLSYATADSQASVDYDTEAGIAIVGDDLEARVKSFYGGKLPVQASIEQVSETDIRVQDTELIISFANSGIKHRFLFDQDKNIAAMQAEDAAGEMINFTRYFEHGSLVSQETYNSSGYKIFSSSAIGAHAYNAGDFAFFAYAKEAHKFDYDENLMSIQHSYGGHLKASIAGIESRLKFLN